MREIIFRGKRTDNGEWVEGSLIQFEPKSVILFKSKETDVAFIFDEAFPSHLVEVVITETVGQYTGLTDKNGKKIFEGDIVKREFTLYHSEKKKTRETQIGVVTYSDIDCGFYLEKACNLRKPWDGDTLEIIGNIHDNPELLKGGG